MSKSSARSIVHCAVLAALAALSSNAAAGKFLLEGEAVDLNESFYEDILGGQYFKNNKAEGDTFFGPGGSKLYDTLQNFESTNIHLKEGTTVGEEVIGGTYMHSGSHDLKIEKVNLTVEGSTINKHVFGGNKINSNSVIAINSSVDSVNILLERGTTVKGAVFAGSSVKSQLVANQTSDSNVHDHVDKSSVTVIGSILNGIAGGSLALSADSSPACTNLQATVNNTTITVDDSTVNKFHYFSDGDYAIQTSGAIYAGGIVHSTHGAKSFLNALNKATIIIRNGSEIKGNVVAGGMVWTGKENKDPKYSTTLKVSESSIAIADSHVEGDIILGNEIMYGQAEVPTSLTTELVRSDVILHNSSVDGKLVAGNLLVDKKGTQPSESFVDNQTKTSLTASGSNILGGLSGVKDITLNVTEANLRDAVLTIKDGTLDLQDATIVVDGDLTIGASEARLVSLLGSAQATGNNTKIVGKGIFVDQVWQAEKAEDLQNLFQDGSFTTGAVDFTPQLNANARTLSEIRLGTLAFINQGAEFIADEGLTAMTRSVSDGLAGFAAVHGGYSEYSTGTDVDLRGSALVAGAVTRVQSATLGAFVEAGRGSSEAGTTGSEADGDHAYAGLGAGAVWNLTDRLSLDGAIRIGLSSTEFDGKFNGETARYDSNVWYGSAHIGLSTIFPLANDMDAQAYGRYVLSFIDGDDLTMDDADRSRLYMDDSWTHAVRIGGRLIGAMPGTSLNWTVGLAYEHVFDGDSESAVQGIDLVTPSLGGDSAIAELSIRQGADKAGAWGWGVGIKGYLGDRQGVTGQASVLYAF